MRSVNAAPMPPHDRTGFPCTTSGSSKLTNPNGPAAAKTTR